MYKSQIGQDKYLDEVIFKGKRNGVFVEVGALNGVGASNTYFFEKDRNWTGLLIEPNVYEFNLMMQSDRTALKENCAISNKEEEVNFLSITGPCNVLSGIMEYYNTQHLSRIKSELAGFANYPKGHEYYSTQEIVKMQALRLQTLFDKYSMYDVNLVSIDVEGAEMQVLESIDFNKTNIDCFLIENNYGLDKETEFLEKLGYIKHSNIQWDLVFIKNSLVI